MKYRAGFRNIVINQGLGFALGFFSPILVAIEARAQLQLPDVVPGEIVNSIKGTSLTRSSSSGGKSSLSFGSNTTFGTSASINSTSGSKVESISDLKFNSGTLTTRLGGSDDSVKADIGNIRANDLSVHNSGTQDTVITSGSNTYSNGNADITGIFQENLIDINGEGSTFRTKAATVHGGSSVFEEISQENVAATTQTASGSSGAMLSTNTTVDINTSEFVNSFQQAY